MPVAISMLRGVNLGPHRRIKMEDLRKVYESVGLKNPQTYVQSGNVIFESKEKDLSKVAKKIEAAINKSFGFHSDVIIRSADELREIIRRCPFANRKGMEPNKLLVTFLAENPGAEARKKAMELDFAPEELHADGRELYGYFPNGLARPKMSWPALEKILKTTGTGRNWTSVTKMLAMVEKLEGTA